MPRLLIDDVDAALTTVDDIRGNLGAVQNRFESTIANLNNVSENLSAARSRILDADIAQETSNMTKQNILQQAGVCHPGPGQPAAPVGPESAPVSPFPEGDRFPVSLGL